MSFRFIHCADLHLDTPFQGISADNPDISRAVRESTFEAFDSVTRAAIENRAEFVLIAGDMFDAQTQSVRAVLKFRDMLQKLHDANIRTFMVHGNHDPAQSAFSAVSWPESVHVFPYSTPETVRFRASDNSRVSVTGQSHEAASEKKNLAASFPHHPSDEFRIALLHADAGVSTEHAPYAPCTITELKQHDFDYWALGHVHTQKIAATSPHIVYPGCIQGRSFRETGPRGCFLVEVHDGKVRDMEFLVVDAVRWDQTATQIDDILTVDSLEQAMLAKIESMSKDAGARPLICRLDLTGRGPLYRELYREKTRDDLMERLRDGTAGITPFVWVQDIRTRCMPEFDISERMKGDDFLAKVLAAGEELALEDETVRAKVLKELCSDRRVSSLHICPDPSRTCDEFRDIVTQAQMLCADLLEGDSEA